jgi:uncharacterized protein (DUF885 family)
MAVGSNSEGWAHYCEQMMLDEGYGSGDQGLLLGQLQDAKLREDYKRMKGADYTLQGFHDAFLAQGSPPIKIVRRALLGNDSPVL